MNYQKNVKTCFLSLLFVILLNTNTSIAQQLNGKVSHRPQSHLEAMAQIMVPDSIISQDGTKIYYRLAAPLQVEENMKYPLVISLHGAGLRGSDNIKQLKSPCTKLLIKQINRTKYPCFVFAPQCPENREWGSNLSKEERAREVKEYGLNAPSIEPTVFQKIELLKQQYPIDKDRIYLIGSSLGAYGVWHLLVQHPNYFAAAIPICGASDTVFAAKLVHIPIWAFHGADDKIVPTYLSRNMVDAISRAGGQPKYTEYEGRKHSISGTVVNTPGLLDWLFSNEK